MASLSVVDKSINSDFWNKKHGLAYVHPYSHQQQENLFHSSKEAFKSLKKTVIPQN